MNTADVDALIKGLENQLRMTTESIPVSRRDTDPLLLSLRAELAAARLPRIITKPALAR
ncbi:MAG: hypothetical protein WCR49_03085 [Opitutae bacterium]